MSSHDGTTFLKSSNKPPGGGIFIPDDLCGMFRAGMHHDDDSLLRAPAIERTEAIIARIDVLNGRVDLRTSAVLFAFLAIRVLHQTDVETDEIGETFDAYPFIDAMWPIEVVRV